jgi:hypothetical protein
LTITISEDHKTDLIKHLEEINKQIPNEKDTQKLVDLNKTLHKTLNLIDLQVYNNMRGFKI